MTRMIFMVAALGLAAAVQGRELRVCADPNNLPFSNERREGFENRIVERVAKRLGATLRYTWWAQRRGFLRNTLNAGTCDVVPGIASGVEMLGTTRPYYRSSYVFVVREGEALPTSLDDETLKTRRIGVQLIGDDGANTPPAHALARRGIAANVRGFPVYGDYATSAPQAPIVDALVRGDIDVAVAWGPVAGWFAQRAARKLVLAPVTPWLDGPQWPMVFDVSMA
ncbi:MAG TPA: quinoprotein dehydrogenase-associated putative ABC transporter substrate-binding protein, partial [Xanthomonadales bacterium]|nr:quinoprotein dehydrogenase-associated putative ABC transporter substrate-binding protein [Xanthomonadales bacterium]